MFDAKNHRTFLKRSEYPSIQLGDLFIGGRVTVNGRQLKVVDYGDVFTRKCFEAHRQRTFAMIKPDCYAQMGKIIDAISANGFIINKLKMSRFTKATAEEFYGEHRGKPFFDNLVSFITSDVVVGMELVAENAIEKWRQVIGPTSTDAAKREAPHSLRALFGTDNTKNAVHGSDSSGSAKRETAFFFTAETRKMKTTAILNNCSLCVIKPHIVYKGIAGKVLDSILAEGFEVSAMEMFYLDRPAAEEFYDVYKGVLPEYVPLIEHITTGPLLVLEVRQENVVNSFRAVVGPNDPEIAKHLRPNTIR